MTKYRKKPVVIEAIRFEDTSECLSELSGLGLNPVRVDYKNPSAPVIKIKTLEGIMIGSVGDYIIKGVNREFYPCKPDIFEMTYEKVNGENSEVITKETSLGVIIESLIEGRESTCR